MSYRTQRREACKCNCPLTHFRAKLKIVQHSVRAWKKAGMALWSLVGYTDFHPRQGLSLCLCPLAPPNTGSRRGSCFMVARGGRGASCHLLTACFPAPVIFPEHLTLDLLSSVLPEKHFSSFSSLFLPFLPFSLLPFPLSLSVSLPAALSSRFES